MLISQIAYNYNISPKSSNKQSNSNFAPAFCATPIIQRKSKIFEPIKNFFKPELAYYNEKVEQLARGFAKLLDNKFVKEKIIEKAKKDKWLVSKLLTTGAAILTSLYITKTLSNKDLDEKKRKTLAINQGAVFIASTALSLSLENKLRDKVAKIQNNFEAVNFKRLDDATLKNCIKGIGLASTLMVFDVIFRFATPVFVTPLANAIGNYINEKKDSEPASK